MMVVRRPWASGCRATPAIVWLPARPSPMAAPTAPPPRASPPPTIAPASRIASDVDPVAMTLSSPFFSLLLRIVRRAWRSVGDVRGHGRLEVDDGEQGEDEGLDGPDAHVEELPD